MNEKDMQKRQLQKMDVVNMISTYDGIERTAYHFLIVPYQIPTKNLAAYFPETNVLVPYNHFADKSKTPISKSIKVRLMKV